MHALNRSIVASTGLGMIALLAGCGVSKVTKEAVASSETAVMQAQQTVSGSESGAMELQRARDHLADAKQAVDDGKEEAAVRHAQQATLDARLATVKSQSAIAQKAVADLRASIQTLRQETERSIDMPR